MAPQILLYNICARRSQPRSSALSLSISGHDVPRNRLQGRAVVGCISRNFTDFRIYKLCPKPNSGEGHGASLVPRSRTRVQSRSLGTPARQGLIASLLILTWCSTVECARILVRLHDMVTYILNWIFRSRYNNSRPDLAHETNTHSLKWLHHKF